MSDLRVGVVGLGIGQMHLLSWLGVDGAAVTVIADVCGLWMYRTVAYLLLPSSRAVDAGTV